METDICMARQGDAADLLDIFRPYVLHTAVAFNYEPPTLEEFRATMSDRLRRYPYLAARRDGELIGYAYASPFKQRAAYDWAVETTIYVRRECRGKGVGRALYEALERSLKGMGICNLNACIAYTNHPDAHLTNDSMLFHGKLGYELVGTFHHCGCKFGSWYDMIWMEKIIGPHLEDQPPVRFGEWTI